MGEDKGLLAPGGLASADAATPTDLPAGKYKAPPQWAEGKPPKPGVYIGFSVKPERRGEQPSLYTFDGETFQHWTGWYDHGLTHWLATDMEYEPPEAEGGDV